MTATMPELLGFTEHSVDADGFTIRYWERGQGEQPLVVIHGAGGPDGNGGGALELLAENHRVIAVELPGFGQSETNTRTQDGRQMAATVASAVAALGVEKYSVSGTSMGAIVALWMAADHPDNVVSVVLEAPAAFRICTTRPENMMTDRAVFIRAFHARPERKPWVQNFTPNVPAELYAKIMGPDRDEELVTALQTLEMPVLALFGTKDLVINPNEGRLYKELITDCYFLLVYDAAHDLKGDRPEAFAEVVGDFLTYGPKFLANHRSTVICP
ncbi:alpha/beta fold hydrolase [Mycobacterium deserti]|uniref:Alpha/beta hydrolase n=1 Tax=Mycobacterium deserti TaxID=2978347 RepID=A0ABT2MEI9_9MYCO|nr:alpha/beta hydrolase [Mycobacterium deserti]MCT7660698.1 alpha/beta hydrolase [Mycobacterium deserti]